MKNSLFKRAAAAVATVPLALGQCLTYSSFAADDKAAETSTTAAASEKVTLDTLLYIDPTEFEGYSQWNTQAAAILDKAANKSGTINVDSIINTVTDQAGKYKAMAEALASKLEKVEYSVDETGNITITAKIGNAAEALNDANVKGSFARLAKKIADNYGVPEIETKMNAEFAKFDISGTIKVDVLGSMLDSGTKVTANYEFRPTGSKAVYDAAGTVEYVKSKLADYKAAAYKVIEDSAIVDKAGAKADVDKRVADYEKFANKGANALTKFNDGPSEKETKSYDNISSLIADVNAKFAKYNRSIPASGAEIAANSTLVKNFNEYKEKVENNVPYTFDITADQLGAFADSLSNINIEGQAGNFKLEGIFDDAEAAQVEEAYNSTHDDTEYVSSNKKFTVTADTSNIKGGSVSIDVKIQRQIVTKPKTATSSTSTTTTSTTTTTTTTSTSIPEDVVVTTSFKSALPEISADYGFYTEIDEKFALGQIKTAKLVVTYAKGYTKADGTKVDLAPETETIDLTSSITYGDKTPANTYSADSKDFKYAVPVVATDDIKDSKGNVVFAKGATVGTVTAYIGLKGDANLDGKLTAVDASYILKYYAELSSGKDGAEVDPLTVTLCRENELVTDAAGVYDNFAAFLGDVRNDINADIAWSVGKIGRNDNELKRQASATDASAFLKYYALVSGNDEPGKATWAKVLEG